MTPAALTKPFDEHVPAGLDHAHVVVQVRADAAEVHVFPVVIFLPPGRIVDHAGKRRQFREPLGSQQLERLVNDDHVCDIGRHLCILSKPCSFGAYPFLPCIGFPTGDSASRPVRIRRKVLEKGFPPRTAATCLISGSAPDIDMEHDHALPANTADFMVARLDGNVVFVPLELTKRMCRKATPSSPACSMSTGRRCPKESTRRRSCRR